MRRRNRKVMGDISVRGDHGAGDPEWTPAGVYDFAGGGLGVGTLNKNWSRKEISIFTGDG